jgi:hypothetical protein
LADDFFRNGVKVKSFYFSKGMRKQTWLKLQFRLLKELLFPQHPKKEPYSKKELEKNNLPKSLFFNV